MSISIRLGLLSLLLLIALARASSAQDNSVYTIDNYELIIEAIPDRADWRVTMDISYLIKSGKKSTGFKYIGEYDAQELSGRDEAGRPIRTSIKYERETKLDWSFSPAGPGKKRVIISFVMLNVLTRTASGGNELAINWAGVFKVPVARAVYRFVFPDDIERTLVAMPADYANNVNSGRRQVETVQAPLGQYLFKVNFWPPLGSDLATAAGGRRGGSRTSSSRGWGLSGGLIAAIIGGFVVVVFGAISWLSRGRRVRSHSDSWWTSGTCSGGSSCSS